MRKVLLGILTLSLVSAIGFFTVVADEPLIIGTTDRVTELSFANSYDHFSWHVLRNTTDALTKVAPGTGELVGGIAESWDISADGLEYTFYIRPGITF